MLVFLVYKVRITVVTPLLHRLKIKEDSAYEGLNTMLVTLREERRRKSRKGGGGGEKEEEGVEKSNGCCLSTWENLLHNVVTCSDRALCPCKHEHIGPPLSEGHQLFHRAGSLSVKEPFPNGISPTLPIQMACSEEKSERAT